MDDRDFINLREFCREHPGFENFTLEEAAAYLSAMHNDLASKVSEETGELVELEEPSCASTDVERFVAARVTIKQVLDRMRRDRLN